MNGVSRGVGPKPAWANSGPDSCGTMLEEFHRSTLRGTRDQNFCWDCIEKRNGCKLASQGFRGKSRISGVLPRTRRNRAEYPNDGTGCKTWTIWI